MKSFKTYLFGVLFLVTTPLFAGDFQCEVMHLEGSAYRTNEKVTRQLLKEGDLLDVKDTIETDSGSTVDLAFDKEWKNVLHIDASSKMKIAAIHPTNIRSYSGGAYAKLGQLPKDSSFEIQTPTAVAAVRGTEFQVLSKNNSWDVLNFSTSLVSVYGLDDSGNRQKEPIIIKQFEKTDVPKAGAVPSLPKVLASDEKESGLTIQSGIKKTVETVVGSGRTGKLEDISTIEKNIGQKKIGSNTLSSDDQPQIVDNRRRAFKGV